MHARRPRFVIYSSRDGTEASGESSWRHTSVQATGCVQYMNLARFSRCKPGKTLGESYNELSGTRSTEGLVREILGEMALLSWDQL